MMCAANQLTWMWEELSSFLCIKRHHQQYRQKCSDIQKCTSKCSTVPESGDEFWQHKTWSQLWYFCYVSNKTQHLYFNYTYTLIFRQQFQEQVQASFL
jgi:hypothetical protein